MGVLPGYSYSDVPEVGVSIVAITNNDPKLAREIGEAIARKAWEVRDQFVPNLPTPADAVQMAQQGHNRKKAVLIISDGNDTGSQVSPPEAAQRAASLGIPVYTVAIGNVSGAPPASIGPTGTPTPTSTPSASISPNGAGADVALLREIAATTGARTFTASTAGALDEIYKNLGASLSVELKPGSNAGLFVALAVVMALSAASFVLLGSRPRF